MYSRSYGPECAELGSERLGIYDCMFAVGAARKEEQDRNESRWNY